MRIFYSENSDPMILDSVANLKRIYRQLVEFTESEYKKFRIDADIQGNPEPYSEFLPYMEFLKSEGKVLVKLSENMGLVITGSTTNLIKYIEAFKFSADEDGTHHHPDFELINENAFSMGGLWPFVESDNDYVAEHQGSVN